MEEQATATPARADSRLGRDLGLLVVLLLLAGGIRAWLIYHTEVTARDSIGFIRHAWELQHEPWRDVLRREPHPPLYPLTILAVSLPVRYFLGADCVTMQFSAQLASALAGVLLVVPMFYLGKGLFNRGVGFWGAALFQCLPDGGRMLSDGLSEAVFLLLTATALLVAVHALRRGSALLFGLCGLCAGLAYLTRPEGVLIVAAAGLVLLSLQAVPAWRRPWRRTLACAASLALTALAVGSPYAAVIGGLTNKQTGREMLKTAGAGEPGEASTLCPPQAEGTVNPAAATRVARPLAASLWGFWSPQYTKGTHKERLGWGLWALASEVHKGFHYVAWAPALLGLWWFRHRLRSTPGAWVLLALCLLHVLVLLRLAVVMGYVSDRHVLILVLCTGFWAVAAVQEFPQRFSSLVSRLRHRPAPCGRQPGVELLLLLALTCYSLPATLKPLHANRAGHHAAGVWLAEHAGPAETILDPFCWAEYYAGRTVGEAHPPAFQPGRRPSYVVVARSVTNEHARLQLIPDAERWAAQGQLVYHWPVQRPRSKAEPVEVYFVPPGAPRP